MYAQHKQNTEVLTNTPSLQATVRSPEQHITAKMSATQVFYKKWSVILENNKES